MGYLYSIWYQFRCGSGCGSVGRIVASNTRGPLLKSGHRYFFIINIFTVNVQEVYYPLALIMGCGVVERHLAMAQPTKKPYLLTIVEKTITKKKRWPIFNNFDV